jgi:RNA polymerase sigma-70 factor (ECF subfamily)
MDDPGDSQPHGEQKPLSSPGYGDNTARGQGNEQTTDETNVEDTQPLDVVELIRRHQVGLWRYLKAVGCDATTADDLTQETFLRVLCKPFEHRNDAATGAYLRRVAHNLFISHRRRSSKMSVTEKASELEEAWTRWAGFDQGDSTIEALRECMSRLTDRARLALQLRFADQSSRTMIGDELGISEHGAKNLMQRAKAQLRECLESKLK